MLIAIAVTFLFGGPARAADFTYEDLVSLIQSRNLSSVETVLPLLPTDLRSNYTLMYDSRSLQQASVESPRAILFGSDGQLICSFNGDPALAGNDSLECVQFRAASRSFDFRQIEFPTPKNGLKSVVFSASGKTATGNISCNICHGADPRPQWDNYNKWPGAFGQDEDKVAEQAADYRKFVARRDSHPRYQWLIQDSDSYAPYRDDDGSTLDITRRPNLRLVEILGRLNALRAARLVEALPAWESAAYVTSALHCDLTSAQQVQLTKKGFNSGVDLQISALFADLKLPSYRWSTEIMADPSSYPNQPWEFQSGFSMFSENVAMAMVQEVATAGDTSFSVGLQKIANYYAGTYFGAQLAFDQTVNAIVMAPDFFGTGYANNLSYLCPEAAQIYVNERLGLEKF